MPRTYVRLTVSLLPHEVEALDAMADAYTDGNRSMMVRRALRHAFAAYAREQRASIIAGPSQIPSDDLSDLPEDVQRRVADIFARARERELETANSPDRKEALG
jgi:metal-responsive CopG/Arc/MetJ family transcriptional regulator